eukprot:357270-Chlamydomonas_euryale.AAC.14
MGMIATKGARIPAQFPKKCMMASLRALAFRCKVCVWYYNSGRLSLRYLNGSDVISPWVSSSTSSTRSTSVNTVYSPGRGMVKSITFHGSS